MEKGRLLLLLIVEIGEGLSPYESGTKISKTAANNQ